MQDLHGLGQRVRTRRSPKRGSFGLLSGYGENPGDQPLPRIHCRAVGLNCYLNTNWLFCGQQGPSHFSDGPLIKLCMATMMHDAIRSIQKQAELISQSTAAYNSVFADLVKSTSAITSLQDTLAKQFKFDREIFNATSSMLSQFRSISSITSNFDDLTRANERLTSLVSAACIADSSLSKVFADHSALRASIAAIASQSSVASLLTSLDTTRLLNTSLTSQSRLLQLEAVKFGSNIDASALFANDLASQFGKLTRSYRDLIDYIPEIPEIHIPLIATLAPLEYSLELDVLEGISVDHAGGNEAVVALPSIDSELAAFDEKLLILIRGARQSLESGNPDRPRHVTTSVRELFTHILHRLAPDDEVGAWSDDEKHFHNGRPTRRARLLYICRQFSCEPLTEFVENDVKAAISLIDSLHAGTHVVESRLTTSQLEAIVCRMEALALFLLRVSKVY